MTPTASSLHVEEPPVQGQGSPGIIHPRIVRITHWVNAVAMFIMIGSGWRIYNDSPIFDFRFPAEISLGGDPGVSYQHWQDGGAGGALQWHFAGMWLLVINGLVYYTYTWRTGRARRMLLPVTLDGVSRDVKDALSFKLDHTPGIYNHVQRLLYMGVLALGVVIVISGLAIWKPVQFQELTALFLSFQGARLVHFFAMAGIVGFVIVHVTLALLVPRTIVTMVTGEAHHEAAKPSMPRKD